MAVPAAPESIKRQRGRPRRDVSTERIRELRTQGLSFRQIANRTGFGYGTVRRAFFSESVPQQSTLVDAAMEHDSRPDPISLHCAPGGAITVES